MSINQFSDMLPHEIEYMMGAGIEGEHRPILDEIPQKPIVRGGTPVDWRGKMNAVRNQGSCGSCWSFAATATFEGRYAIKKGSKVELSEQQMVDCATACNGCGGGWSSRALQYIQSAGGQMSRASYPYTGVKGSCKFSSTKVAARVSAVSGVSDAKSAVASGPVAVYLQATSAFQGYGGGIFNGVCGQYNHAVTVVGWGASGSSEYWIIRNSWGSGWGESGHIRVLIGGNCRITFDSYPVVA
jgi:C1A family cysteine protease